VRQHNRLGSPGVMNIWLVFAGITLLLTTLFAVVLRLPTHDVHARSGTHNGAGPGAWPTFLYNNAHTGYNASETAITASTAASLKLQWTYVTKGEISAQSVVAAGRIYAGSWDGNEYATDLTGKKLWSASIGGQVHNCNGSQTFGVASTATIADVTINGTQTTVDFVGGQNGTLYALDATTGSIIWNTPLSSSPGRFTWSSPAIYNGSIYIGIGSIDDCPLVRGALVQLNAATGTVQNTFYVVPSGCLGGSIWSTPAIDETAGAVYVTTGNHGPCSTQESYAEAIVKLSATNLSVLDFWKVPSTQLVIDSDFGATPTLSTATISGSSHQLVGAQNKNGTYYALDRTALASGPVWSAKISTNHTSIASSAWDGINLYVAGRNTTIGSKSCNGSLRALNPATGAFIWQDCLSGLVLAPVSVVPGVVFVGAGSHFYAIAASTGAILFNYTTSGAIQSAASISNGVVYVGNKPGILYAFGT
jgi:outer membrane protein assembly factor BamB